MATGKSTPTTRTNHPQPTDYANCLVKPMGRNGEPLIQAQHVIDAALVASIVFFAILAPDVLAILTGGRSAYLTVAEIVARIPTALIAFGLTFCFQFARARGIDVLERVRTLLGG